ncbi:MAG TPA: SRPBCC domain-containing protein [Caulobacteraceae bacterium]|jgi:hypothetical protein
MALPLKIEYRVGVQTPAQPIWDMIMDIDGWPAWNPLYPQAKGKVGFDARLDLTVAIPGEPPREIHPTIVDWTPNEQIIWRLSLLGGLIRSTRYIETETLENGNVIFSNGEIFEGPALRLIGRKRQKAIKAGFAAFGEAVRTRVEAAWKAEHPDATSASA